MQIWYKFISFKVQLKNYEKAFTIINTPIYFQPRRY